MTRLIQRDQWRPVGITSLEPAADAAVRAIGNTLVTAGPGAGKTELLGQRGVFLLQTGACAFPRRLLAISYKRDAARNLRERFQRRCSREQVNRLDSLTFDAFAKLILDRFWRALPEPWSLPKPYVVARMLTRDQFGELQRSAADGVADPTRASGWVAKQIGSAPHRNELLGSGYDAFNRSMQGLRLVPLVVPSPPAFLQLVQLRRALTEFDPIPLVFPYIGLLAHAVVAGNPMIRDAVRATYSHVFMDEFQDTTGIQYNFIRELFGHSGTVVTAVGDDKQKIMGWAGAQDNAFDVFAHDFLSAGPGAGQTKIVLFLNYRSNERIVQVLNVLKKRLAPAEPDFRAVREAPKLPIEQICSVVRSTGPDEEASAIARFIAKGIAEGLDPRKVGLLVRQKAAEWEGSIAPIFNAFGLSLRNEDRDLGGAAIQDLMSEPYAIAMADGLALLLRKRGGAAWSKVLETIAGMEGLSPEEEVDSLEPIVKRLDDFHTNNRISDPSQRPAEKEAIELLDLLEQFFSLSGLRGLAAQYQQGDYFGTLRTALRNFIAECAAAAGNWLEMLARYRGDGQVPLLTITKSKGLEYDIVFLLGLDDDQWWSFRSNPTEGHSTFFVAASRARERLFMTICKGQRTSKISEVYDLLTQAGVPELPGDKLHWVPALPFSDGP